MKLSFAIIFLIFIGHHGLAQFTGTPILITSGGNEGVENSLQIVNGNPAISYYDIINGDLKYVRANDVNGTSWNTPLTIDATGNVGQYTSLQIVNGNPAISYCDWTNHSLKYIRANDVNGNSWGTPISIGATSQNVNSTTSLKIINGNPAISYFAFNEDLKYIRANDVNGSTWGTSVLLDASGTVGRYSSLQVVNGIPAISYQDESNYDLKYIRANDANGTIWGTPMTLDAAPSVGWYTSLQIVNGNPSISYVNGGLGGLKYIRANNADGTDWGTPQILDAQGSSETSLQIVNGKPAISYGSIGTPTLKYIDASDINGSNWEIPQTLDASYYYSQYASMQIVNGEPAISYYHGEGAPNYGGHLRYIRNATVLPIELISFEAVQKDDKVYLTWQTANEINNDHFDIEYSPNGRNFSFIGSVMANNNAAQYHFIDQYPFSSTNYYRLKQVDIDGSETISKIVSVNVVGSNKVKIYPTIFRDELNIESSETIESIEIFNNFGKVIFFLSNVENLKTLPSGIYFLRVRLINGAIFIEKVIKD